MWFCLPWHSSAATASSFLCEKQFLVGRLDITCIEWEYIIRQHHTLNQNKTYFASDSEFPVCLDDYVSRDDHYQLEIWYGKHL